MSGADTRIEAIVDYEGLVLERLVPRVFSTPPRLHALLVGLAAGAQACEDELFDLHVGSGLEDAAGAALDQWAALVGEERGALDDTWLRQFIRAKILATRSQGASDDLIRTYAALTGFPAYLVASPPACFYLFCVRDSYMPDDVRRRVARFMAQIKPAAVEMVLMEAVTGYQGFDGDTKSGVLDEGLLAIHVTEAA